MEVYAIHYDNGETYEDHDYYMMDEHVYRDRRIADKICRYLNTHPFTLGKDYVSKYDYENSGYRKTWKLSYGDYVERRRITHQKSKHKDTYTVQTLKIQ